MNYIASKAGTFKRRCSNHAEPSRFNSYHNSTALFRYIRELKNEEKTQLRIRLSIVMKSKSYEWVRDALRRKIGDLAVSEPRIDNE